MNRYFNFDAFFRAFLQLLERLPYTLGIVVVAFLIAAVLGTVLACLKQTGPHILRVLVTGYVWLMRGAPLLLLLFISYYGIPLLIGAIGIHVDSGNPLVFALIAFSLSLAAFFEEMMRAALDAVDVGQSEAAKALDIPRAVYFIRIVLPQALIHSLPNFSNLLITAIKQSSILFTVGIADMFEKATTQSANDYGLWQLEIFLALLIIYWLIAIVIDNIAAFTFRHELKKVA